MTRAALAVCGLRFAVCGLRFAVCGLRFARAYCTALTPSSQCCRTAAGFRRASTRRHIDASTANRPKWRSGVAAWRRMTEDSGIPARRGSPRHAAPYRAERPPPKTGPRPGPRFLVQPPTERASRTARRVTSPAPCTRCSRPRPCSRSPCSTARMRGRAGARRSTK
ncbi:hypothetical protein BOC48_06835 [Burkholderia pseudomallei]|nr:hypothetical protein BOC48_06835 [Burkholderia pseudomallei]